MIWKPLNHPLISEGYLISDTGFVRSKNGDEADYLTADYNSTNGYDFIMLIVKEEYRINNSLFMLFPIDELLGITFIPIPQELINKPITIKHANCDTRNIDLSNLEWVEDIEEWRECTYPGVKPGMYEISSWGNVRNIKSSKIAHPSLMLKGKYQCVRLMHIGINNSSFTHPIHHLVAYQFLKTNVVSKCDVNHINGNGCDNYYKNLEYVTHYENSIHAIKTGLKPVKLTDDIVIIIWGLLLKYKGNTQKVLKQLHDMGISHINRYDISDIKRRKSYTRVTDTLDVPNFDNYRINESLVRTICELLIDPINNMSPIKVIRELHDMGIDIPDRKVYAIKYKTSWKRISDEYF